MARTFDGTIDKISAANSASLESAAGAFTIFTLFNPDTTQLNWSCMVEVGGATIQQSSASTRQWVGAVTISTVFKVTAATTALAASTWYAAALRWASGGTVDLTIFNLDGSLNQTVSSTSATGTIDDTGKGLTIGSTSVAVPGTDWFHGALARVVYDSVVYTDDQCRALIRGLLPSRGITGAYLELFGTSSPEPDWSGNGNHGTVSAPLRSDHPPMISAEWLGSPVRRWGNSPAGVASYSQTAYRFRNDDGVLNSP